jgi:hypothetical protein
MDKNKLNQSFDIEQFKDLEGVTANKLNIGLWIVTHRRQFFLMLLGALVVVSTIFYGYTIYSYVDYVFFGGQKERQAIIDLTTAPLVSEAQRLQNQAQPVTYLPPQSLLNNGKYDFLVKVKNPNSKFFVNINYCFTAGGTEVACAEDFVLPDEEKYVFSLGNNVTSTPSNLDFVLKNVRWDRLDLHKYPNWPEFKVTHLNFSFSEINFKSAAASGLSQKLNLNTLDFKVKNESAYNLWAVPLTIILFNGQTPIAIQNYMVDGLDSLETRAVKIAWPDSVIDMTEVKIFPSVNILDDNVYRKYQ